MNTSVSDTEHRLARRNSHEEGLLNVHVYMNVLPRSGEYSGIFSIFPVQLIVKHIQLHEKKALASTSKITQLSLILVNNFELR